MTASAFTPDSSGVAVQVFVQPGASRTSTCGLHDGAVKVRVAAPPEKGAANKTLSAFFAEILGVRKTAVRIVRGTASRQKTVHIEGVSEEEVRRALGVDGENQRR
jgi:uncharacterized protein (TIGR00251 family)